MPHPRSPRTALLLLLGACTQNPLKLADSAPQAGDGAAAGDGATPDSAPPADGGGADAADGSGVADGGGDEDSDGDGLSDEQEGLGADGSSRDTDFDGSPDHLDLDSDNDGILDAEEGPDGRGGLADTDGDGTPDFRDGDSDGDGLLDREEGPDGSGGVVDTDGDGVPDYRDLDSDADSVPDQRDGATDADGDGVPNWRDPRNDGHLGPVNFVAISTPFNQPVGIDFHEATGRVVMSVNYPTGSPSVLETVDADGNHAVFSSMSGLTDEVKIATARSGNVGGFALGELFVGNGLDGQIVRVSADGSTVQNPWVELPGDNNGLMRGSLYVDPTGAWGGDLVVATTLGQVWRVTSAGVPSLITNLGGVHLEGLITVPDAPLRYGPLAGKAIAGAENEGLLYAFSPDGTVESYNLGVRVEDVDMAWNGENFFGVNFGTSRMLGISGAELVGMGGDILLTQEGHTGTGLYRLWWDGAALQVEELVAAAGGPSIGQWEHVTFARAGIKAVP